MVWIYNISEEHTFYLLEKIQFISLEKHTCGPTFRKVINSSFNMSTGKADYVNFSIMSSLQSIWVIYFLPKNSLKQTKNRKNKTKTEIL